MLHTDFVLSCSLPFLTRPSAVGARASIGADGCFEVHCTLNGTLSSVYSVLIAQVDSWIQAISEYNEDNLSFNYAEGPCTQESRTEGASALLPTFDGSDFHDQLVDCYGKMGNFIFIKRH